MNARHAITHDAMEARLVARFALKPSSAHRDRVLTAVQDALHCPATMRLHTADMPASSTATLAAMALSAALVMVLPWLAFIQASTLPATQSVVAIRARAAGVDPPAELSLATVRTPRGSHGDTPLPLRGNSHEAWRIRRDLSLSGKL